MSFRAAESERCEQGGREEGGASQTNVKPWARGRGHHRNPAGVVHDRHEIPEEKRGKDKYRAAQNGYRVFDQPAVSTSQEKAESDGKRASERDEPSVETDDIAVRVKSAQQRHPRHHRAGDDRQSAKDD